MKETVTYAPSLSLRIAEVRALEELPSVSREKILPFIRMRPWSSALKIEKAVKRLEKTIKNQDFIIDLDDDKEKWKEKDRQASREFAQLCLPTDGYQNWCDFVKKIPDAIPCLQTSPDLDMKELEKQYESLKSLKRGVAARVANNDVSFPNLDNILNLPWKTNPSIIALDCGELGKINKKTVLDGIQKIFDKTNGNASVIILATGFPEEFKGVFSIKIKERDFFESLKKESPDGVIMIYGDKGSTRERSEDKTFRRPNPRIDYPTKDYWHFFRSDNKEKEGYVEVAQRAMRSPHWDKNLKIYGTKQIERTAQSDAYKINSPMQATAARINIHLHLQALYDSPESLYNTDDDWDN